MRAIIAESYGGSEALRLVERPTPTPGPGEALVRVEAAGVNFIDIYLRTGLYKSELPVRLGREGAGVVESVGPDVTLVRVGERVAWTDLTGSYASHVVAPVGKLVPVPAALDARRAATAMLQGMTAHYLARDTYPLGPRDTCVVHAAAGGVGMLLCQLAKRAGATVIGTTSSEAKAERARAAGADHVVLYTSEDFSEVARRLTGGLGVSVVYDSVGRDTWEKSLASLRPRGMLVLYGQSSGAVPPIDPFLLSRGSFYLTRAVLNHYTATREELLQRAAAVFDAVLDGSLTLTIDHVLPLTEAARAHDLLASRATSGKILLVP